MCDCNDEINNGSIPIGPTGPAGPTGPQGPAGSTRDPGATSTTLLTVATGAQTFTAATGTGLIEEQLVRIANPGSTKVLVGTITDVIVDPVFETITVDVNYIEGTGSGSDWIIAPTGARGATGATGAAGAAGATGAAGVAAYTTLSVDATPLGGSVYQIDVVNSTWISVGQMIYVQSAGYYLVTSKPSSIQIIVDNPSYTGNNPAALTIGKTMSAGGLRGLSGTNGTNGTNGFIYETLDGNGIAAEAADTYELLMRNSTNTGYTFVTLADLKILLASA
jgi:hypothetical protein